MRFENYSKLMRLAGKLEGVMFGAGSNMCSTLRKSVATIDEILQSEEIEDKNALTMMERLKRQEDDLK